MDYEVVYLKRSISSQAAHALIRLIEVGSKSIE